MNIIGLTLNPAGARNFFSPKRPDRLWGPPSFLLRLGCAFGMYGEEDRFIHTVEAMNCADIEKSFTEKQFLLMETQKVASSAYCTEDSSIDTLHQDVQGGELAEGTDITGSWFVAVFSTTH